MKVTGTLEDGLLKIDIYDLFKSLSGEQRQDFLKTITYEEILPAIEAQLKHETECYWWSTSGDRDGAALRQEILKIQGLEPEFKKDLEAMSRHHEHDAKHYKKYYDWYFKLYHLKNDTESGFVLLSRIEKYIGRPTD